MNYEIKELIYRSKRVYFYAIDKETDKFCFGISKTKAPELVMTEDNCYSKDGYVVTFKNRCYYEINTIQSDKDEDIVKLYTFNEIEPQEERNFFNQLISLAEQS